MGAGGFGFDARYDAKRVLIADRTKFERQVSKFDATRCSECARVVRASVSASFPFEAANAIDAPTSKMIMI